MKRKVGVTEHPRSLNPSKAMAMAICPIIVHFSTWRARSMHDVACEFAQEIPLTNRVRGPYRKLRTEFFPPRFMAQARSAWAINRRGKNEDP